MINKQPVLTMNIAQHLLQDILPKIYEWNNSLEWLEQDNFKNVDHIVDSYNTYITDWTGETRYNISDEDRLYLKLYCSQSACSWKEDYRNWNPFLGSMINPHLTKNEEAA